MRNLKKILALVLALVMSLSLMAAAGASQFPDVDESNPYKTAITALDELKVFQGFEDGTFKPTDTLNRAQAAVLVYRIATGDVENKYLDNYTFMQQSQFTDLDGYNWAKGYINYCQNAGIVVGTSSTTFEPYAKVTGYQLLVMLLRTLGYGKAGEFSDPKGWELQTAAIAEREGITKNVTNGDFHSPAARQMVAEILFRGLLTETVEYSPLTPGGYTKSGVTLGKRELGLEDIKGVVMANEWADLRDDNVLADGKTVLNVDGKTYNLEIGSELTDIGEIRHAYVQNGTKVLTTLEDLGDSTVSQPENGKAAKVKDLTKVNGDTQYFLNFAETAEYSSDYKVKYVLVYETAADAKDAQEEINDASGAAETSREWAKISKDSDGNDTVVTREIPAKATITSVDLKYIEMIFGRADKWYDDGFAENGAVYVGTQSNTDISDVESEDFKYSYDKFYDEFINDKNIAIDSSVNGEWLKAIDNDGDGVAEYVFKTEFWMDEAINTYTLKGETHLDYYQLDENTDDYDVRYIDEVSVGDVVVYTLIDGKANVCVAEPVPATIKDVLYKSVEIVTTDGETMGQSGITNDTEMDDNILNMADKTEYDLYLDEFGFVRAYKLPGGTQYGLVTEAYYGFGQNGSFVQKNNITVELGLGEAEITEYNLSNAKDNDLVAVDYYSYVAGRNNIYLENYLQPAVAHLGEDAFLEMPDDFGADFEHVWGKGRIVREIDDPATAVNNEWPTFDYGTLTETQVGEDIDHYASMTNIAVVSGLTDDSVALEGAAKFAYDKTSGERLYRVYDADTTDSVDGTVNGHFKLNEKVTQEEWEKAYIAETKDTENATLKFNAYLDSEDLVPVYAVDYVQLDRNESIAKGARHYEIDDHSTVNTSYKALNNNYVNATHDTQYYIVGADGHTYFTDYANVTAIDSSNILAAYTVARDTNADKDGVPYWVADVIVIEVKNWDSENLHSISLAYFEPKKSSERVHCVETLNNESEDPMLTIVEKDDWGSNWKTRDYGFYKLFNAEMEEDELMVGKISKIAKGDYNANGIYAGTFLRTRVINNKGGYVDVLLNASVGGAYVGQPEAAITMAPVYTLTSNSAKEISWSSVDEGDHLIFVVDLDKEVTKFVVHLGADDNLNLLTARPDTPAWLWAEYAAISEEQGWTGGDPENVQCLIDAATWLLDEKAAPSLYQLTQSKAALDRILAAGSGYKMTSSQKDAAETLQDSLESAIAAAGTANLGKFKTAAKDLADKRAEGYTGYDAVDTALGALKDAIDAIDELGDNNELGTIFDGNKLNPTNTNVIALDNAIKVAKDGEKAIAAAKALVVEKNGTADMTLYPATKAAYDDLVTAIKGVANAEALEAIFANGELVKNQAQVAALIRVLPETPISEDDAALAKAIAEAKGKIDTAFGITEAIAEDADVIAAKAALEDALDACETAEGLAELYNTGTKKFVIGESGVTKDLQDAVEAAIAQAEEDAANELIAAAVEAIGNATIEASAPILTANATTKPSEGEVKALIKDAVDAALENEEIAGVEVTVTLSSYDGNTSFASLTAGDTGASITYSLSVADTAGKGDADTSIADETITVKWYLKETGATAVIDAISVTAGSSIDSADTFASAAKDAIDTALPGATATVSGATGSDWNQGTQITFNYSVEYPGSETAITKTGATLTLA